jgi:hypothetical protein
LPEGHGRDDENEVMLTLMHGTRALLREYSVEQEDIRYDDDGRVGV